MVGDLWGEEEEEGEEEKRREKGTEDELESHLVYLPYVYGVKVRAEVDSASAKR